jgi:cell division protein FtsW (lipid II flippase)
MSDYSFFRSIDLWLILTMAALIITGIVLVFYINDGETEVAKEKRRLVIAVLWMAALGVGAFLWARKTCPMALPSFLNATNLPSFTSSSTSK